MDSKGNNLAGTLTPIFDKEQVQRELAAQVRITQAFSQVAPKAVGDYASNKFKELMAAGNKEEAAKWADGGIYRVALHTIVGGLSGNLEGALGAGTSAAAIPRIAEQIKALDIPTELKEALILATASAIGSVTGGTTGAGAALSEAGNNYLKHAEAQRMDTLLRQKAQGQCGTACEQEIASLTTLDNSRNQALQGCANVSTPDCNTARQEVRNAAAEYILANVQGTVLRYAQEKGETLTLAQQTLSGLGSAELKGFSTAIVDGIANALKGGYIAIAALGGDEASSEKVGQFGASLAQFLKVPGNWQALVGGLSKDDREKLAAAYAAGDGDTVGRIIGAQVASIPIAGAELGVGTKLAKLAKAAGVVNVAEKTKELIRVAEAANVTEAAKYTNRLDVSYRSASEVNTKEFSADYNPPYQVGTRVTEYTTKDADQFVRVSLGEQAAGQWMMRKEAIQGLTPEQIAQKYSLPAAPQYISDVNVPAGTQVRTGSVATNFGGNQGAIQYQLISPIPNNSFTNTRPLR